MKGRKTKLWDIAQRAEQDRQQSLASVSVEKQKKIHTLNQHISSLTNALSQYSDAMAKSSGTSQLISNQFQFKAALRQNIAAMGSELDKEMKELEKIQQMWAESAKRKKGYQKMDEAQNKAAQDLIAKKTEAIDEDVTQSRHHSKK